MEWTVERYWTLKQRYEWQMETFRNQPSVFATEYFARVWEAEEDWQISMASRQFYWHSLVTLDGELNGWLGLPVVPVHVIGKTSTGYACGAPPQCMPFFAHDGKSSRVRSSARSEKYGDLIRPLFRGDPR